jgi:EAL and modified HD-GYP domain-containing signal transduction protein
MSKDICVARQPVVDRNRELFAYELLFKGSASENLNTTARVLEDVLGSVGIEKMVGKSHVFLNCEREFLVNKTTFGINPETYVLEVSEKILSDAEVI